MMRRLPLLFIGLMLLLTACGGASKRGILVKGGNYLEALANAEGVKSEYIQEMIVGQPAFMAAAT